MLSLLEYVCFVLQVDAGNEALEANFVRLVQRLLEDADGREHFLKVWLCSGPATDSFLDKNEEFFEQSKNATHAPNPHFG